MYVRVLTYIPLNTPYKTLRAGYTCSDCVDFESEIKDIKFLQPEGKYQKNGNRKNYDKHNIYVSLSLSIYIYIYVYTYLLTGRHTYMCIHTCIHIHLRSKFNTR